MACPPTILGKTAWRQDTREAVAKRAGFRCQTCFRHVGMHGQADHIIPRAQCAEAGISEWDLSNLQWLCAPCHSAKTNAERWAGHQKRTGPKPMRRSKVPGRNLMLAKAGVMPMS